jgi:hypothetical protein
MTASDYLAGPPLDVTTRPAYLDGLLRQFLRQPGLREGLAALVVLGRIQGDADAERDLTVAIAEALPREDAVRFRNALREGPVDRRILLARQLVLAACRMALLVPEGERQGQSTNPVAATVITHLVGDAMPNDVHPGGETLAGMPPALAMGILQNQTFNEGLDVVATIDRTVRLWRTTSPKIESLCGGRAPAELLLEASQLEVEDFVALGFAHYAHSMSWSPGQPVLISRGLGSGMADQTKEAFYFHVAAEPSWYVSKIETTHGGEWDFLAFQERPIVDFGADVLVLDSKFLFQRVTDGLYWIVHDFVKSQFGDTARLQWTQAWGEMVESCVEEQLVVLPPRLLGGGSLYYTEDDLKRAYPGRKAADVVIDGGEKWVAFEIVSGQLTVGTRVEGQVEALMSDLEKLVFKKTRQLDSTAQCLLERPSALTGTTSEPMRRVIPVIVAGGGFPVNPVSARLIEAQVATESLFAHAMTDPLCILDLEELDMLEALREQGHDPCETLALWKRSTLADVSFRNFVFDSWGSSMSERRPSRTRPNVDASHIETIKRLQLPDEPPSGGA